MKAQIQFSLVDQTVKFLSFNGMDAVSLDKLRGFDELVYLYVYDTRDRIYIEKAYAWSSLKPGTIVYLQENEKKAKVITQVEYETFKVFQDDQND